MMQLTVKKDGTIDPLGLYWLRDSKFQLMAGTRDSYQEIKGRDGVIDFGAALGTGEITLELINQGILSPAEKSALRNSIVSQLNQLREYGTLVYESDPGRGIAVRLNGKPGIRDIPKRLSISVPLLCQPLWYGVTEHSLRQSGTAINQGTFAAPVTVEINGPCQNPSVTIGGKVMTYNDSLALEDQLVIDTGAMTAACNGVNAIAFNGVFPLLLPGSNTVSLGQGNTTVRWFDCWI